MSRMVEYADRFLEAMQNMIDSVTETAGIMRGAIAAEREKEAKGEPCANTDLFTIIECTGDDARKSLTIALEDLMVYRTALNMLFGNGKEESDEGDEGDKDELPPQ